jgi:hypothetical protein
MERVHAFFEGHDDEVFYRRFLEQYVAAGSRLYGYRCDGKQRVYEAFSQITARYPAIRSVLFFVDKDLDDILGLLGGHFKTGHSWTSQNRPPRGSVRDWWRFTS